MRLLELEARTYIGKEYRDFMKSQEEDEEEGNEWKRALMDESNKSVPKAYPSRILINPNKFITAIESYSLEEMVNNPEGPQFDSVDLCLEDGIQISLVGNMDDFLEKWNEYHEKDENKSA